MGKLIADVVNHGSTERRDAASEKLPMIAARSDARIDVSGKVKRTASSPVPFRLVIVQPERSHASVPAHAISTHSSDVPISDPIHITSLMTARAQPV